MFNQKDKFIKIYKIIKCLHKEVALNKIKWRILCNLQFIIKMHLKPV